jgi:hypothetical protein
MQMELVDLDITSREDDRHQQEIMSHCVLPKEQ